MTNDQISSNARMTNLQSGAFLLSFALRHSFVIRYSSFVICLAFGAMSSFADPPPSAKEILASVRMLESRQQIDLQGQLRQNDVVIPFQLVQNGPLIRYSFTNPDEVLQLRLGENSSRLDLVSEGEAEKFPASKLDQRIRGTGVTYEDLSFKFLYWPTARVLGEEKVRTRNCWKLQLRAPSRRVTVFKFVAVGGQGERRADADGRLRFGRAAHQALRSRVCAKDRGPLVFETNACGRIRARHESRAGEDVSGN